MVGFPHIFIARVPHEDEHEHPVALPTQPRYALAKGVGGGPRFQADQGLLLELLELSV